MSSACKASRVPATWASTEEGSRRCPLRLGMDTDSYRTPMHASDDGVDRRLTGTLSEPRGARACERAQRVSSSRRVVHKDVCQLGLPISAAYDPSRQRYVLNEEMPCCSLWYSSLRHDLLVGLWYRYQCH